MARAYTAKEMRKAALVAETVEVHDQFYGHEMDEIAAMLRQVADEIEREERHEKRYQYEVRYKFNGRECRSAGVTGSPDAARLMLAQYANNEGAHIVRREVGEWEAFDDGQES